MGNIRQQKLGFTGKLSPTGVDPNAGASLRQLAGIADQASQVAFNIGAKKRKKEGELAGQVVSRDAEGNVIAPQFESDLTVFGESFNKSAILAHRAQIQIDSKSRLDALQEEHKLDPEAFRANAEAFKQGTLKSMPEELANIISLDIDSSVSSRMGQLNKDFFRRQDRKQKATVEEGLESATDDILNATRTGDIERQTQLILEQNAALDAAVEAGMIDPVIAANRKEDVRERIAEQSALREIDEIIFNEDLSLEEQVSKGVEFLESLRTSDLKDLSPEQKDSLINVVNAKVGGLQTQLAQERSKKTIEQTRQISNLKINAGLGLAPPEELMEETEKLFNNGLISGNERTSIITDILKGQKGKIDIAKNDDLVAQKLGGRNDIVLDQKVIDSYYKRNVMPLLDEMPPELKVAAQANFITQLRAVPKQIKQEISNNILSGDPDLIIQAGDLVDRIDEVPGLADLAVNASQRAFIQTVTDLSTSLGPEQAVILAKELTDPRDKARIEAKENEIKSEKMEEDYDSIVEDNFESFFGTDLLVDNINKSSVNREYKQLFESYFKAGMSKDRAEEKAINVLKTNWKESQFGFMKHPPESFYQVGSNVNYIKKQLKRDITTGFVGFDFNVNNIFLLSDEQTARKASQGHPDYRVMVIDDNGELQVLKGRWAPDMQKEQERQLKENEKLFKKDRDFKTRQVIPELGGIN